MLGMTIGAQQPVALPQASGDGQTETSRADADALESASGECT